MRKVSHQYVVRRRTHSSALLLDRVFYLPLPHLDRTQRDQLWRRVWSQYEDFLAKQSA